MPMGTRKVANDPSFWHYYLLLKFLLLKLIPYLIVIAFFTIRPQTIHT